jgi:hypothetical protein
MEEVFQPKFDWWMKAIILGIFGMAAFLGYTFFVEARLTYEGLFPLGVLLFIIYSITSTKYILRSKELVVVFGPFRFRYPFSTIVLVRRGSACGDLNQPVSVNFTFSTEHLTILLKSGAFRALTISPSDQGRFLRLLATRGVKVEGPIHSLNPPRALSALKR